MKRCWAYFASLVLVIVLPTHTARSQIAAPVITIMEIDTGDFPIVRVRFLAADANDVPISNLGRDAINMKEGDASVDISLTSSTIGIQAGFLADLGAGNSAPGATGESRRLEMQRALEWLFSKPWMVSGQDTLFLSVEDTGGTRALTSATHDSAQLLSAIRGLTVEDGLGFSNGLAGVSATLDFFCSTANEKGQYRTLVFFSSGLQSGGEKELEAVISKARTGGIPIETVLFRQEIDSPYAIALRQLAGRTGGRYFFFHESGIPSLQPMADRLEAFRKQYIVSYRSKNKQSGIQVIQLGLKMAGVNNPAVGKYEIDLQAPTVKINSPQNGGALIAAAIEPEQKTDLETTPVAMPTPETTYVVDATVNWPDSHPRNIAQAELLINGKPAVRLPDPKNLYFRIPSQSIKAKIGTQILLQIRVMDELGFTATSDEVDVTLGAAGVSGCGSFPAVVKNIFCPAEASKKTAGLTGGGILPILTIVTVLLAAGLVMFFRKPVAQVVSQSASAASGGLEEMRWTMRFRRRSSAPKAYLVDLDGASGLPDARLELFGTTSLGRSRENADSVLQSGNSASALSRLHCTLIEEDDEFFIRDEQSANGTYLNGIRLAPLERTLLKEGDEIGLAKGQQGGVQFRFQRTRPEVKLVSRLDPGESDATHYEGR